MPLISVIVPIYNMERLMRKCLDSILAQTFQDYECLLIDDGSRDGSPAICDEYAARDARFRAYHKPNGGLSDARNYGLERAQGEYTIFFDPDDWVDVDCLTDFYAKAKEDDADMVMCDLYYNDPYRQSYCKQEPTSLHHNDVLQDLITGKVFGFTVTKLIRRTLYQQYDIQYPVGMYGREDQYTMCNLLKNDIKIAYLPKAFYHYMHYGLPSQSSRYEDDTLAKDMRFLNMFKELLADTPYLDFATNHITGFLVGHAFLEGRRLFTNKRFLQTFKPYERDFWKCPHDRIMSVFYWFSFCGCYRQARYVYGVLLYLNRIKKKMYGTI